MARKLAWLFVALIAIADLVLISTVLHSPGSSKAAAPSSGRTTAAYPAPEMITPTRAGNGSAAAGPPVVAAPNLPNGAAPAPPPSEPAAPTEGIQVLGESRVADAEPTPAPVPSAGADGPGGASWAGPILLDVDDDGTIVRAARGACPSPVAAPLSLSLDGGASWMPVDAGVPQILGIGAAGAGATWYVGTDQSCRPVARESADAGSSWRPGSVAGRWYLNPDRESTVVASPRLVADVGCVPLDLAAIDARRAAVACADGEVRVTGDGGDSWTVVAALPGVAAVTFATADRGFALVAEASCRARVLRTEDGGATWTSTACLGDSTPRAIAAAEGIVVAQTGSDLVVSRDGGATWRPASG
jgi:hypothetical protein